MMGRGAFAWWKSARIESPRLAQRLYLAIAAPTLFLLCFLSGPFEAADEPAHFLRIVAIANGDILPLRSPEGAEKKAAGAYEDRAVVELASKSQQIAGYAGHHYSLAELREKARSQTLGADVFAAHSNTAIYPPLLYAIPALVTIVARAAQAPPFWWLYLGRLANAAAGLAVVCFALRTAKDARLIAFACSLLPITLFQMASVSVDALLIPLMIAFAVLQLAIEKGEQEWQPKTIALSVVTVTVCVGKVAYLPLSFLPPLVARGVDGQWSPRARWLAAGSLLSIAAWVLWAAAVHGKVFSIRPNVEINPDEQLRWIFAHPGTAMAAFLRSLVLAPKLAIQAVGARLGWGDLALPSWFIYPLPFLLAGAAVPAERPLKRPVLSTSAVIVVALLCCCAVLLLIYLQYNEVGAPSVDGLQGRYFTPLVIVVLAAIPKMAVQPARMRWIWTAAGVLALTSATVTIASVAERYW